MKRLHVIISGRYSAKRQVQILQDFHSDVLCCTPSYAMYIGETLRDMGIDPSSIPLCAGLCSEGKAVRVIDKRVF